ncbi:MAG: lamin tail domain-containing protein [Patescibacteria group bacterium]|nr:lamin tail domain-containing protein [Patescibacteria group bacterium]
MFKKRFWIILFLLIFPFKSFAYDNLTTHPALTSEIVKFYNNFYTPKINEEERNWLINGSTKEDEPISRTLNHFFDPVYNRGLNNEINAGALAPFLRILKPFIQTAKEWAQNSYKQAMFLGEAYKNAALNPYAQLTKSAVEILSVHTWEKAIYNYIIGNKKQAFEDLGHVLHLLEDMGVPAHTRNDHHLRGDDYEKYTSQFTKENINIISQLKDKKPLVFNKLNDYFNDLASYTNSHFYSQDTIGIQSGYNQPEWNYLETKSINNKIYSFSEDEFGFYYLLRKDINQGIIISTQPTLILDALIHESYWSHLSKKIVLSGAGVLRLFFEEVEKYRDDQEFLKKMRKTLFAIMIDNFKKNLGLINEDEQNFNQNENQTKVGLSIESDLSPTTQEISQPVILSSPVPQNQEQFQEIEILQNQITPSPIITPTPIVTPSPTFPLSITPTPFSNSVSQIISANSTIIASSETPSPSPSSSPFLTPTITPSPTPPSKILISEILYDAGHGDEGKEFIELYNPNDFAVDLSGWSLRIIKNNSTSSNSLATIKTTDKNNTIPARGFYLIGLNDYDATNYNGVVADIIRSYSLPDASDDNVYTIYLIKDNEIIDSITYDKNMAVPSKSLERKAKENSTSESMSIGEDKFLGNGYDSDSMDDFVIRDPQPQNSLNLSEPRSKPTSPKPIENKNNIVFYETQTNSLIFQWLPSYDAKNSSEGIIYSIFVKKEDNFLLLTSTSALEFIYPLNNEEEKTFDFKMIAYDRDQLASDPIYFSANIEGLIFVQDVDSEQSMASWYSDNWYRLGRGFSGILKSLTLKGYVNDNEPYESIITLKEFEDENYTIELASYLILSDGISFASTAKEVKINNLNIPLNPYSYYRLDVYQSRQNRSVILLGTTATGTAMYNDHVFGVGKKEFIYVFYPFIKMEGILGSKVDFSIPQPPTMPELKSVSFDNLAETIYLEWSSSTDLDSLDSEIVYEYNVSLKDSDFDETKWRSVGKNLNAIIPVKFPNQYKIGVRAVDNFGMHSDVRILEWQFPSDFVIIQEQREMEDKEFNPNPYVLAQIFVANQSGYVKGLKLFAQQFFGQSTGDMQVFLYNTDNYENISENNLIASSDKIVLYGGQQGGEIIVRFNQSPFLEKDHKYLWAVYFNKVTSNFKGTCTDNLSEGFASARFGSNNWVVGDCYVAPLDYYFVLIGSTNE